MPGVRVKTWVLMFRAVSAQHETHEEKLQQGCFIGFPQELLLDVPITWLDHTFFVSPFNLVSADLTAGCCK